MSLRILVLASHDISAGECAGYSAAAGDIGSAVNAALWGEDGKVSTRVFCCVPWCNWRSFHSLPFTNSQNGALDALRVLNDSSIEKAEPYYYKHALTLLTRAPMATAKSFLTRYSEGGLSETKLLPSFIHYERKREENKKATETANANARRTAQTTTSNANQSKRNIEIENSRTYGDGEMEIRFGSGEVAMSGSFVDDGDASIKFLEGVIKQGSKSRAIYNYLTSLYARMEDEGPLFRFLSEHTTNPSTSRSSTGVVDLLLKQANDESSSPLDKSYALRTILRTGRHFRSAVKLYMVRNVTLFKELLFARLTTCLRCVVVSSFEGIWYATTSSGACS